MSCEARGGLLRSPIFNNLISVIVFFSFSKKNKLLEIRLGREEQNKSTITNYCWWQDEDNANGRDIHPKSGIHSQHLRLNDFMTSRDLHNVAEHEIIILCLCRRMLFVSHHWHLSPWLQGVMGSGVM